MTKNNKPEAYKHPANPELNKAMQELRRSSAASVHDVRPNRERSRLDAKRAAIKDQEDND